MPLPLDKLYGLLRAQILSRHFAVGKYFRADHLSFANHLGVVQETSLNDPMLQPDAENNAVHGCLWSDAEVIQPTTIYNGAVDLLALAPQADPPASIQINSGAGAIGTWLHDRYFNGGHTSSVTAAIVIPKTTVNAASPSVYQSERLGVFTYTIPHLTAGRRYTVRLHFAELAFSAAGSRAFNVAINGTTVLNNFDILATAGAQNTALVQQFMSTADPNGQISISYQKGSVGEPKASGIEIIGGTELFERWRIGDHDRTNPLMYSGQLMVCLAVESVLGIPDSLGILSRLLATMKALLKFANAPYDGYILRWDAVRSDRWQTYADNNRDTQLDHCCEFLTDSTAPDGYLYCTPLDDPRYVPYMRQSDFDKLPLNDQNDYQKKREISVDRYRYWEASMDELTGLLTGYSFVSSVVSDPGIQAEVADQVKRMGNYLASNAYLLVRPGGDFCAQGASGILPALEFPFGRIFSRVAGSPFASQTNFEGALKNAGLWPKFSTAFALATIGGIAAGILLLAGLVATGMLSFVAALIPAIITAVGGGALGKALVLYLNSETFDVHAWPGHSAQEVKDNPGLYFDAANNNQQTEFAGAYLLSQLPSKLRFTSWLFGARYFGKYALNFPPFLGLSALNDSDHTVRDAYLGWFNARGGKTAARLPTGFPSGGVDDATDDFLTQDDPFATAVAVNLGAGQAEQVKLVSLLADVANEFATSRKNELAIYDDSLGYDGNIKYVTEAVRPALNFMAALALAWYFSKTQSDAGNPLPPSLNFPTPPASGTTFPAATVPQGVVNAPNPERQGVLVPPDALPSGDVPQGGSDLFSGSAPTAPSNPPPPVTTPTWVYAGASSHYGNWFGDNGTDTINASQMVTGAGCQILGVKLQLVNQQGAPLDPVGDTYSTQMIGQAVGVGSWPFAASAQIVSVNYMVNNLDEAVVVSWQYSTGRAIRYRIGYLLQGNPGVNCSL